MRTTEEETAFPRGGRRGGGETKPSRSSETEPSPRCSEPSSSSSGRGGGRSRRKRRSDDSTTDDVGGKDDPRKKDFLFGPSSVGDDDDEGERPSSSGKTKKRRKDDSSSSSALAGGSASRGAPLGGGHVRPPSEVSSSSHGRRHVREAFIESLSFQKLSKGTKLLGIVREATAEYAAIGLPNMLTGFVRRGGGRRGDDDEGRTARERAPPLTSVLTEREVLPVVVLRATAETIPASRSSSKSATTTKRRIELSASPEDLNSDWTYDRIREGTTMRGTILSVEDHGCVVDLGLSEGGEGRRRGFVRFEDVEGGYVLDDDDDGAGEGDSDDEEVSDDENDGEDDVAAADARDDDDDDGSTKRKLNPGRIHTFLVASVTSGGVVRLALPSNETLSRVLADVPAVLQSKSSSSSSPPYTIRTLQPGTLVSSSVERTARNGLCVTFLGNAFRGSIDSGNLGGVWLLDDKKKKKKKDGAKGGWRDVFRGKLRTVAARIIAVDPTSKAIRLSLLPHLLSLNSPPSNSLPSVGTVIENAIVARLDPGVGALLALPPPSSSSDDAAGGGGGGVRTPPYPTGKPFADLPSDGSYLEASKVRTAYVHISKSMDPDDPNAKGRTTEGAFAKRFAIGSVVPRLRVLSVSNLVDDVASCATAESIVSAHVLTHFDVRPGEIYRSVPVEALSDGGGVVVTLGGGVRGLIPPLHLFDKSSPSGEGSELGSYRSMTRMAKYKPGRKIDVRCLSVDPVRRKCLLTAKKSLLSDDSEPLTSYDSVNVGDVATGFVSKSDPGGVYVTFYGGVYGRVDAKRLALEQGVVDPTLDYGPGDVAKARVVERRRLGTGKGGRGRWRLELSFGVAGRRGPSPSSGDAAEGRQRVRLRSGTVLPAKSMKVVQLIDSRPKPSPSSSGAGGEGEGGYVPGHAVVVIKSKRLPAAESSSSSASSSSSGSVECRLPYDQLFDSYEPSTTATAESLDEIARSVLRIGRRIDAPGLALTSPSEENDEGVVGRAPTVSLRPNLVAAAREQPPPSSSSSTSSSSILLPSKETRLYMGAVAIGYVARIDPRFGAFVRFLDGLTGLVPKLRGGLDLDALSTVRCKVVALDLTSRPVKILLGKAGKHERGGGVGVGGGKRKASSSRGESNGGIAIEPGDDVGDVEIVDLNFARAKVKLLDGRYGGAAANVHARVHVTLAEPLPPPAGKKTKKSKQRQHRKDGAIEEAKRGKTKALHVIEEHHPFYNWTIGTVLPGPVKCVAVDVRSNVAYVELTNRPFESSDYHDPAPAPTPSSSSADAEPSRKRAKKTPKLPPPPPSSSPPPIFVEKPSHLPVGARILAIVTHVPRTNAGMWVQACPGVASYVPALEVSDDPDVLNDLEQRHPVGSRIECVVVGVGGTDDEGRDGKRRRRRGGGVAPKLLDDDQDRRRRRDGKKRSEDEEEEEEEMLDLSVLRLRADGSAAAAKPKRGDLVVGRINRSLPSRSSPPALTLELRGGRLGRCDVTELDDVDGWTNLPLGRLGGGDGDGRKGKGDGDDDDWGDKNVVTDEEEGAGDDDDDGRDEEDRDGAEVEEDDDESSAGADQHTAGDYPHGKYVRCRVLSKTQAGHALDVSLRPSRVLGNDLDDDPLPRAKDTVHAYVVSTNRKGCFVRLARDVEGRVILKELSDGFLPDPAGMFPPGRLVVGKVKEVRPSTPTGGGAKGRKKKKSRPNKDSIRATVDLDMRESVLLESEDKLTFDDVTEGSKHSGVVSRIEAYGVFVRLDGSDVSGLAHMSECSDGYIKNLAEMYDPGDPVKVVVLKVDKEQKRIGLSLKASYFENDEDSDDDESSSEEEKADVDSDVEILDVVSDDEGTADSDDENYASKLAAKMGSSGKKGDDDGDESDDDSDEASTSDSDDDGSDSSDDSSDDDDDDSSDDDNSSKSEVEEEARSTNASNLMDANVGFDWGTNPASSSRKGNMSSSEDDDSSSSEDESDDEDGDDDEVDNAGKSSHKSRKKAAARRREEKEISQRETALADGTADENPETAADFERLLASNPNCSEHWIKYMAYHLSLADVDSARNVADRAFDRIEFRQENEKLNVWTALLTLELKYGGPKSLQDTIDRACKHNNPKQVYLRVCEMLEREVDASTATSGSSDRRRNTLAMSDTVKRADAMFTSMCKKFKSKKTVWIAHLKYLLKGGRHEEAHGLLKRSLMSLPTYKHLETVSKFAQLEFEHGSVERARTVFDGLLKKYPKRLDLLFVYIDKEAKRGEIDSVRKLFERVVSPPEPNGRFRFSDKQMKSLFKKWYRFEEDHGNDESCEHVKRAAKTYIEQSAAPKG